MIQLFPNEQTFILFRIGSFTLDIRWYAVLIMCGAFLAYHFAKKAFKEAKYTNTDFLDSLFIYTLWVGVMGARLWFCVFYDLSYYLADPIRFIRIWDGGLAIQGGLVAGALFAWYYCRKNGYPFLKIIDMILPHVMLAQAIGRWGNFINRECHGGEVSESYFNGILSFLKEGMYINGHYYEPLFFYESMLCLLGWALIWFVLRKRQNKRGDLAYAYLMWYGVIRFFIEGRRTDSLYIGNLKMAQLTSIVFVIIGLLGYLGVLDKLLIPQKPTLMFDLDGTLADTREGIQEAFKALFEQFSDVSLYTDEVKGEVIGPALRDMYAKYFPGIDYDTLYKVYRAKQIEVSKVTNHPTPHSDEVLRKLHEEGYKIGIISTRSHQGIEEILESFGLRDCVDDICGLKDVEKIKPDPEGIIQMIERHKWNKDCVMIGDSLMDMQCGNNYGAYTVAYIYDPKRTDELTANSNVAITDMAELLPILKKKTSFTYNEK